MPDTGNDRLRAAREASGLTQGQLAELANAQVETATGKPGAMDADYIGKLERGVHSWPNQHYRHALRTVLRTSSDGDLGFRSRRTRPVTVRPSPHVVMDGGDDVERKAFLRVLAGSVAGLAFVDPVTEFTATAATGRGGRVGATEVDQIRHLARMFANQDHLFGGGMSAHAAVAQVTASSELLGGQYAKEAIRRDLFAAVADLADTAGGMCFDAGLHEHAERCFRFAVGTATEADDWSMRAKALSGMANLAVHQDRPDDALSFAELALVRMDRLTPLVQSVMHTRHARALGALGARREADCLTAIGKAEETFAARSSEEPGWIAYYNLARLERDTGRALLGLALNGGDYRRAQQSLTAAVNGFPSEHSRGKALALANLATVTMARDDPEHGAQLGQQALTSAGPVRSDRVLQALQQLRQAGQDHRSIPAVRELNHQLNQLRRTPASR